jgi:ABC-type nitrate/sulfonate/bicarbonate transport system substrate-binding protein
MQLKSGWIRLGGALLATLFCAVVASGALAADKIRLGKAQGLGWTFLPADIGVEQGFFAKYGIDAQIVVLAGDAKVQQVLASKSIEFGLGSGPGMAFAAKGSPAIAVAAYAGPPRNISTIVRADSPIKNVADLRGKLIGVSTVGSLTDWLAKQMAVQEGWGQSGVRTVPLGSITASLAALKAHQVDASALATEAGYQLAEKGEARIVVGMERYAPHFITHVVFARKDILAANPGLIERFLKGFFASIAFMKTHKAQTVATAERLLKQSPRVASETYDYEISMLTDDGRFDPQAVAVLKQSFVEMGTLDKKPADDELFTTHFLPVKP